MMLFNDMWQRTKSSKVISNRLKRGLSVAALAHCFYLPAAAQLDVNDMGQASFIYPITVPPGIAGVAPQISLAYGASGIGGVGYGWGIQGVSVISRCSPTRLIDGAGTVGKVTFSATDKLCLDGQRLIQVDVSTEPKNGVPVVGAGSKDADGYAPYREFRTERDTYSRIRAYGSGDSAKGPTYFVVWHKSGLISTYGNAPGLDANTNGLITHVGQSVPFVWPLTRTADTANNFMLYKYSVESTAWGSGTTTEAPDAGREWYLREIQYTGNGSQVPSNKVIFSYGSRPDPSESYYEGFKSVSTKRLERIETYINSPNTTSFGAASTAVLAKVFDLRYTVSGATKRGLLSSVQECANLSLAACLPATKFSYTAGVADQFVSSTAFLLDSLASTPLHKKDGKLGVLTGDFNGDGLTDLIRWSDTVAENQIYFSKGDGTFEQKNGFITDMNLGRGDGCFFSQVIDINGDGMHDLIRYASNIQDDGDFCSGTTKTNLVYFSRGDGSFSRSTISGPSLQRKQKVISRLRDEPTLFNASSHAVFFLLDVNSDGRIDVIESSVPEALITSNPCASTTCTRLYLGNGTAAFTEAPTNLANVQIYADPGRGQDLAAALRVLDADGDGVLDLVGVRKGSDSKDSAWRSLGNGNFVRYDMPTTCTNMLDFNGDGLSDCLDLESNNDYHLMVAKGKGEFDFVHNFNQQQGTYLESKVLLDINGDGLTDILRWNDDVNDNRLMLSLGDGRFATSQTFNLNGAGMNIKTTSGSVDFVVGDFSGRGAPEFLRLVDGANSTSRNKLLQKENLLPPDLLLEIAGPSGSKSTVHYFPLTRAKWFTSTLRYSNDRGGSYASTFPSIDLTPAMYVVGEVQSDSEVGSDKSFISYEYAGLKTHATYGSLGFRERRTVTRVANGWEAVTTTKYLQKYPFIGMTSKEETRLSYMSSLAAEQIGDLIATSSSVYCDTGAASADAGTEDSPCTVPGAWSIKRPYLRKQVERRNDVDGVTRLIETTTTTTVNADGDATLVVSDSIGTVAGTQERLIKTTSNEYFADVLSSNQWIRGRLKKAMLTSEVINALPLTSAGDSANAAATTGPMTQAPMNAVLSVITTLLLEDE